MSNARKDKVEEAVHLMRQVEIHKQQSLDQLKQSDVDGHRAKFAVSLKAWTSERIKIEHVVCAFVKCPQPVALEIAEYAGSCHVSVLDRINTHMPFLFKTSLKKLTRYELLGNLGRIVEAFGYKCKNPIEPGSHQKQIILNELSKIQTFWRGVFQKGGPKCRCLQGSIAHNFLVNCFYELILLIWSQCGSDAHVVWTEPKRAFSAVYWRVTQSDNELFWQRLEKLGLL